MEIFVMNAAARVDGMLGKILSTLNEKNFSCGLKVYSDRMQIVAKKLYTSKIKIFTVGKDLHIEVTPENFFVRKAKCLISCFLPPVILVDPCPPGPFGGAMLDLNCIEVQEIVSIIQECLSKEGLNCHTRK